MNKLEALRWMQDTLAGIKRADNSESNSGICHKVACAWARSQGSSYNGSAAAYIMYALCERWPDGTGSKHYPIPANGDMYVKDDDLLQEYIEDEMNGSVELGCAMYQYEMSNGKWKGEQLAHRLAFIEWCTADISRQLEVERNHG